MKLTKFEAEELGHKIEVIIDEPEMWEGRTGDELEALDKKLIPGEVSLEEWELKLLKEEAEDALSAVEANFSAGFPEYRNDVRKLQALVKKLEAA